MDRRAAFFFIASALGFLLVPVADAGQRWVAIGVGVVYFLLALASIADARSHARTPPRRRRRD